MPHLEKLAVCCSLALGAPVAQAAGVLGATGLIALLLGRRCRGGRPHSMG
jgi:hypothetical protein